MLIKLVEVFKNGSYNDGNGLIKPRYSLRETYVNPDHVVCMREESDLSIEESESAVINEIDPRQEFTKIHINRGPPSSRPTSLAPLSRVRHRSDGFSSKCPPLLYSADNLFL